MGLNRAIVVAGTDTGIGKTVFAAALAGALGADYWKPVQSGLEGPTDSDVAASLGGLDASRVHAESYALRTPVSPHLAAEIDGVEVDVASLRVPQTERPLVVELAGGLLVPMTRHVLQIDVVAGWRLPVVLVARTALGTINHSLLSLEALRVRGINVTGIAFVGAANDDSEAIVAALGNVKRLGRLPLLDPLDEATLAAAFAENFNVADFAVWTAR